MRLRDLPTAEPGLRWMRSYYKSHPQLDIAAVSAALRTAERTIIAHPDNAACFEDFERVREYHIRGTPFALLHTVTPDQILIIDVRDTRGQRSADVLRKFLAGI
ncbi:hypothetical protein ACSV9I_12485 [Rhizobium sp. G187]|uniref:hypothetical protein n=1 Tax=Rhizobium sp. G187 TaxID=3451352 RepID=UPI003EE7C3B1